MASGSLSDCDFCGGLTHGIALGKANPKSQSERLLESMQDTEFDEP